MACVGLVRKICMLCANKLGKEEDMKTDGQLVADSTTATQSKINPKRLRTVLIIITLFGLGLFVTNLVAQKARERSLRIEQVHRLKNLGLMLRVATTDNPSQTWGEFYQENSPNFLIDPISNKPFIIVQTNISLSELRHLPGKILAYPPDIQKSGGNCLLSDGSVQSIHVARSRNELPLVN